MSASLRRRAVVWLLPPLAVLLTINAILAYRGSLEATNQAYDRSLRAAIRAIGEHSFVRNGEIVVDIPYSALEIFDEGAAQERIFYAVLGPGGKLLTGYPDIPLPQAARDDMTLRAGDAIYKGETVRTAAMRKRLYDPAMAGDDAILIVVAETTETRTELARQLFLGSMRRQLALLGVGAALVLVGLGMAFRPVLQLRDSIRQRGDEDLTPVPAAGVPNEILPLIDAINHHTSRISAIFEARKRFLADAAHHLRTPLTVLGTQAEYGLRQKDADGMRECLAGIDRSTRSARRMTNQILSLSRVDAAIGLLEERCRTDLTALVRDVAVELSPLALRKEIDLAFEATGGAVEVEGNASMLRELFTNLIDNAIRYTPAGGHVTVSVAREDAHAVAIVRDDGPGIPQAEREQVFERFYRGANNRDTEGSGLGLAIVREICASHGGRVSLGAGSDDRGLAVTVLLPLA